MATFAEVLDAEKRRQDREADRGQGSGAPLGWRGDDPWPLVEESKLALDKLASGKQVELKFGGRLSDRYDHLLSGVRRGQ